MSCVSATGSFREGANGMLTVGRYLQMGSWIGAVLQFLNNEKIAFIALLFAVYENRKRARVEKIVRNLLRGVAGSVRVVYANANWTDIHFRNLGYLFVEDPPNLTNIRKQVVDGARDAAACARQLGLAHLQIRGIQKALFNDSEETLPELPSDDVKEAHLQSVTSNQKAEDKPAVSSKPL
jgi:hypothetical protein